MIYTARQLEDLQKANGCVKLPRGARLTPLAVDWVRSKRIEIIHDDEAGVEGFKGSKVQGIENSGAEAIVPATASAMKGLLWWCDGPCGPAKAALAALGKQANLSSMSIPSETRRTIETVKELAKQVKSGNADGGILIVKTGAAAMVYANRCPSLRAVLGTCFDSVEQGLAQLGANVLVVEYPYHSLTQMQNILSRFVRGKRQAPADVEQQLRELGSCG